MNHRNLFGVNLDIPRNSPNLPNLRPQNPLMDLKHWIRSAISFATRTWKGGQVNCGEFFSINCFGLGNTIQNWWFFHGYVSENPSVLSLIPSEWEKNLISHPKSQLPTASLLLFLTFRCFLNLPTWQRPCTSPPTDVSASCHACLRLLQRG